ncbi:MAG: type II toxin-antitoxin system BrnA family antitoxin [Cyanobacteriota bacterium]
MELRRVNVDFPLWMLEELDREEYRMGVTRQSIIKMWLTERIDQEKPNQPTRPCSTPDRSSLQTTIA